MPYYVIENFARGVDTRRSAETTQPGALRLLRNAFVNEGGEIEKRKAFVKDDTLTAYGQAYKGKITGPHECPGYSDSVFFRHRDTTLPGSPWTAGSGGIASYYKTGTGTREKTFWAAKSSISLASSSALFMARSYAEFSANGYVVEASVDPSTVAWTTDHVYQSFTNDEPTGETNVTANAGRDFQMVLDGKGYVVKGKTLYASAVGDPSDMAGVGSGALDVTANGRPIGDAISLGDYFGQLAIFGRRGVQFYTVDPDFAQNQYQRTVEASCFAPRSVTGYGSGDILFLGRSGIRSLQARDSSNLAKLTDVGSPIDRLVRAELSYRGAESERLFGGSTTYSNADYYNVATGIVHPDTGQFWLCLKDKVFVLSNYPAARVLAWSEFALPVPAEANKSTLTGSVKSRWVADICTINDTLCFRNFADEVFIYGGASGDTYDTDEAVVETPLMDFGRPGHHKRFRGIDLVCEGEWKVEIATAAAREGRPNEWITVAEIDGSTRYPLRVPFSASGQQIAVRLTTTSAQAARVSQMAIFYDEGAEK